MVVELAVGESDIFNDASRAVQLPEVRAMIEKLASYNLGVYALHMHDEAGGVAQLPEDTVVVEKDCQISFVKMNVDINECESSTEPVGWRFHSGDIQIFSRCNSLGCGD